MAVVETESMAFQVAPGIVLSASYTTDFVFCCGTCKANQPVKQRDKKGYTLYYEWGMVSTPNNIERFKADFNKTVKEAVACTGPTHTYKITYTLERGKEPTLAIVGG